MTTDDSAAMPILEDARHRVLLPLLRAQFAASGIGVLIAIPFWPSRDVIPIFAGCAVALLALGTIAFAPMSYSVRARGYSLVFSALAVILAVFAGPGPPTFLVMCGALILPIILLSPREASGFVLVTFVLVSLVAWGHVSGVITVEVPDFYLEGDAPSPWLGGMITILTISIPFAVLAGLLLQKYQEAHSTSHRLVEELRLEVTEHQASLAALQQAQQRITHAQKLELLGQLAGGLAHDLNNALTAIMGEASFLKESEAESREIILQYSSDAAQLTRQILMLGRKDVVRRRPVDFVAEVVRAVSSARRLLPSEIVVDEQYMSGPAVIQADPTQITQIVLNLVVNARDAMVGGGELRISIEPSANSSSQVDLVITDTGHGIAPADHERVFEPFYSSKPAGIGTGLGLANVKDLVEGLAGELKMESQVGVGTSFRMSFPLVDAVPEADARRSPGEARTQRHGTILLVDDNEAIRRVAKSILTQDGHTVIEAGSGSAAIGCLSEGPDVVDLVITDVVMPKGSGSLVLEWVASNRPELPVLVMSGYTEDEQVKRGLSKGELPFLRKPFSGEELLAATRKLLEGA
jgi:signal transduction histidine kinase/CheY-like chemotaxis protein